MLPDTVSHIEFTYGGKGEKYVTPDKNISIQIELLEAAIFAGANVHQIINDDESYLGNAHSIASIEFLKKHGARLTESEITENNALPNQIAMYGGVKNYLDHIYNLDAPISDTPKIPYKVHFIWITNPSKPREMFDSDIQNIINTKNILDQNNHNKFAYTVWTNDKSLIPYSIEKLEKVGFKVESIYESAHNIKMIDEVTKLIELIQYWGFGIIADILKISLVEHFGGFVSDLNYTIFRDFSDFLIGMTFFLKSLGQKMLDIIYLIIKVLLLKQDILYLQRI